MLHSRRELLFYPIKATGLLLLLNTLAACATVPSDQTTETKPQVLSAPEDELSHLFKKGPIEFGTDGVEKGPQTTLKIDLPAEIWDVPQFTIITYPRKLTPTDEEPAGNWRKNDNPTYLNAGGILVQTVHSGYFWNGTQLPADALRAEVQEAQSWLGNNVDFQEGLNRRQKFTNAPITLEQNGHTVQGFILGLATINPQATQELAQAYSQANGGPVDLLQFSDYKGPALNAQTDIIYFFCIEPYADETWTATSPEISQGRAALIVRIKA